MFRSMGEKPSVNPIYRSNDRKGQAGPRRSVYLGLDVPLLLTVVTLLVFGLVMVYSASYDYSLRWAGSSSYIFSRQVLWMLFGSVVAIMLAFVDYHFYQKLALPMLGATVFLLMAVLFIGEVRNNAARTLTGGSIQPSELAKLVMIIYLSVWMNNRGEKINQLLIGLVPLGILLGGVGVLILWQPDLSAVITILALGGLMFYLAGGAIKQIGVLALIGGVSGMFLIRFNPTGSERLSSYLEGLNNPLNASYHVQRAVEAFVNGRVFGTGIGHGVTKVTGLPVPQTDSIFAVIGEETGLVGAVAVMALFTLLLWRGLSVARRAPDPLGSLLAGGLSFWLALEAFLNMAVVINLLPFAGNALPFISSGGSNLVVSMAAVGILINISRRSVQAQEDEGRNLGAVVDMRWRDGRRRVPRTRRTASIDEG